MYISKRFKYLISNGLMYQKYFYRKKMCLVLKLVLKVNHTYIALLVLYVNTVHYGSIDYQPAPLDNTFF